MMREFRKGAVKPAIALALVVVCVSPALAAKLELSTLRWDENETGTVVLAIHPAGNENVAAIQADILYPPQGLTFLKAETGDIARAAGKGVNTNLVKPGRLRVLVAGINQNCLPEGDVAHIRFRQNNGGTATPAQLTLEGILVADPYGKALKATAAVQAEANPEPVEEAGEAEASGCAGASRDGAGVLGLGVVPLVVCAVVLVVGAHKTSMIQRMWRRFHHRRLRKG